MKLQSDLREFIGLLNSNAVEYLVVGGHAVALHGYPRYTGDIDFWVRPSKENARAILAVLSAFGFESEGLKIEDFLIEGRVIQLGNPPNRIDLLTSVSGVGFEEAWATRVEALLDGLPIALVSREILVRNKRATGRAKDLADVEQLEKIASSRKPRKP